MSGTMLNSEQQGARKCVVVDYIGAAGLRSVSWLVTNIARYSAVIC